MHVFIFGNTTTAHSTSYDHEHYSCHNGCGIAARLSGEVKNLCCHQSEQWGESELVEMQTLYLIIWPAVASGELPSPLQSPLLYEPFLFLSNCLALSILMLKLTFHSLIIG